MEILLVIQVIVVVAMIAVILVQKTGSDGFTGGGSSPNSFLTGRASANLFTRITSILATIFILNSLILAYIASHGERADTIIENAADEAAKESKDNNGAAKKGSLSDLENKMKTMNTPAPATKNGEAPKSSPTPAEEKPVPVNNPAVPASE